MRYDFQLISVVIGCAILVPDHSARGGIKEDDVNVGRNASDQVEILYLGGEVELPPVDGVIEGFALDDPGFFSIEEDIPDLGILALEPDANIVFEVVSLDPALQVWTPGFGDLLDTPGETWKIGSPIFDEHPVWHIDSTSPDYDPTQTVWSGSFRLLDDGPTGYSPSEVFELSFHSAPEAGGIVLLFTGLLTLGLRRPSSSWRTSA